jgi:hypothetical protein
MERRMTQELLEATLDELEELPPADFRTDAVERLYAFIRRAYMRGDLTTLKSMIEHLVLREGSNSLLVMLGELRLAIRTGEAVKSDLLAGLKAANIIGGWNGERDIVLGMYEETQGDNHAAYRSYMHAVVGFSAHACPRRAATAYLNATAALSRIDPNRRLIHE